MRFQRLLHADWSVDPKKRWCAEAHRRDNGWEVFAPVQLADSRAFLDDLLAAAEPVLAGFDFPIGLPSAYAQRVGVARFPDWLAGLDRPEWADALTVCRAADEVSLTRPFYPQSSGKMRGERQLAHLLSGLGLGERADLLRACERGGAGKRQACPLFWMLGANQVGKAAITGWRELVIPAVARGAALWPFEGSLDALAAHRAVTLCETYPADAYGQIGVTFPATGSKRQPQDRRQAICGLAERSVAKGITLSAATRSVLADGFGLGKAGEDPFDALMGPLGMIEVVDGRRPEHPAGARPDPVEGWILGRA